MYYIYSDTLETHIYTCITFMGIQCSSWKILSRSIYIIILLYFFVEHICVIPAHTATTRIGDSHSMFTSCYTRCCNKAIWSTIPHTTVIILSSYIILLYKSFAGRDMWTHTCMHTPTHTCGVGSFSRTKVFFVVVVVGARDRSNGHPNRITVCVL